MIGKLVGALVGAELQRKREGGSAKGALAGVVVASVVRRLGPLGLALGAAYAFKQYHDRTKAARSPER